ncbi:MAG: GNAT family N-acetyltransferase, partial [Chitinophagaceae bacterium]
YQPPFIASSGVFGNGLTEKLVEDFIASIPKKFRLIEINLNAGNIFSVPTKFDRLRNNYVLPLNTSYDFLYDKYRQNIKRNIKKATEAGCIVKTEIPIADVIKIAREQLQSLVKIKEEDFERFEKLYAFLHQQKQATTYGIYNAGNELLASCAYFFSHNRAYYILVGNHPNGKTLGASHYLIDRFIEDHAGSSLLLDFEGSDIRNLAFFYSSFGATVEVYPALLMDKLPWFVRMVR